MAGTGSVITYHDSHDARFDYVDYAHDGPSPSLADLSLSADIFNDHPMQGIVPDQAAIGDVGDHMWTMESFIHHDDSSLWNGILDGPACGDDVQGNPVMDPLNYYIDMNQTQQPSMGESSNTGMGKAVPVWPPDPVPFFCSCCTVLRELVHSDGICTRKLEIHGRIGNVSHAVLEIRDNAKSFPAVPEYQMFDFCNKNIMDVDQFMRQYCYDQLRAGFVMLPDPLSLFYRSLCVGFEWDLADICNQNFSNPALVNSGHQETDKEAKGKGKAHAECTAGGESKRMLEKKQYKSALSKQRARTKLMSLRQFQEYFHLPIRVAAKSLDLCPTVVKNICRNHGLTRWPYRKLISNHNKIKKFKLLLNSTSPEEKAIAEVELKRAEDAIANIYAIANRPRQYS